MTNMATEGGDGFGKGWEGFGDPGLGGKVHDFPDEYRSYASEGSGDEGDMPDLGRLSDISELDEEGWASPAELSDGDVLPDHVLAELFARVGLPTTKAADRPYRPVPSSGHTGGPARVGCHPGCVSVDPAGRTSLPASPERGKRAKGDGATSGTRSGVTPASGAIASEVAVGGVAGGRVGKDKARGWAGKRRKRDQGERSKRRGIAGTG